MYDFYIFGVNVLVLLHWCVVQYTCISVVLFE